MGYPCIIHGLYGSDPYKLLNTHERTCVLYKIASCLTGGPHSIAVVPHAGICAEGSAGNCPLYRDIQMNEIVRLKERAMSDKQIIVFTQPG